MSDEPTPGEDECEFIDLSEWAATTPDSALLSSADVYPEAMEALRPMVAQYLDHVDAEEFSADVVYQLLQDASRICDTNEVPADDRTDLVCDAIREHAYRRIDQEIEHLHWQIEVLRDL